LKALISKYVEIPHGFGTEKVLLGSSNGAIEVEAVNLDKIRGKLSNLQRLREVSLDNEGVSAPDTPGEIRRTCPG
jgi:tubulin-specific chaperone E